MTQPCDVLVLTLPVAADIAVLEEWREYMIQGIAERLLVLPKDATLEIHELPALAEVEVTPTPKPTPKPAAKPAPAAPLPEPVALREKTIPSRWTRMPMTPAEIVADYKQAKRPSMQIKVLADLNSTSEETIKDILAYGGVELKKRK